MRTLIPGRLKLRLFLPLIAITLVSRLFATGLAANWTACELSSKQMIRCAQQAADEVGVKVYQTYPKGLMGRKGSYEVDFLYAPEHSVVIISAAGPDWTKTQELQDQLQKSFDRAQRQ